MSKATTAYVAGLIDGEGSIHAVHGSKRPGFLGGSVRIPYPAVTVAMTHRGVIDWLGQLLGTPVQLHNHTNLRRNPSYKPQYRVTVTGERARALCREVLPYLRVKHEQARTVVDWPEDARRGRGYRLEETEWLLRSELATGLSMLNG